MIAERNKLELLAPAKNLAFGIEAINHGADAVYIGGPQFGARAAAGNPVADIEALAAYAHKYYACQSARNFDHLSALNFDQVSGGYCGA